jgi:ribosome maturation protein SDO1
MSTKFTTVRLNLGGESFEILVHPDAALSYKMGRNVELSQVLAVDEIFSDESKGLRASSEKLNKSFRTTDIMQAAQRILSEGELQLTIEQRRRLTDEKRKQIIALIARNYIDPKTGLPHPPLRVEQALQEVRVSIDPFRDAESQSKAIVDALRAILPMKAEKVRLAVKIPAQFTAQAYGALKSSCDIVKEEWGADGSLIAMVELPAGVHSSLVERLGATTKGSAQVKLMR